jgi:hypothetical protein
MYIRVGRIFYDENFMFEFFLFHTCTCAKLKLRHAKNHENFKLRPWYSTTLVVVFGRFC